MTIRRLGHMDSARSHVQGLLPYVVLNEAGKPSVVYPNLEENDEDSNGNFKQYVCDFGKEIENYDPCGELTDEEKEKRKKFGDKPGRMAGDVMIISDSEEKKKDSKHFYRFKYLDFSNAYHYAKKQIRDGILVKRIDNKDVLTKYECDGTPVYGQKVVWTYKFDDIVDLYGYIPCNFYGKEVKKDNEDYKPRIIPNFKKEGEYGFVWDNTNEEEIPKDPFILIVGISMDENGVIHPNQDKVAKIEKDKEGKKKTYWEYPDTAGKIEIDSKKWNAFGLSSYPDDNYWSICKDMDEKFIGYLNIPQNIEGDYVPEKIAYSDIPKWQNWFEVHSSGSCCYEKIVGKDKPSQIVDKEWTAMGGDKMKKFLNGKDTLLKDAINNIKGLSFLVPNMEFPLLFTNEYRDTGLWTEYVDENGDSVKYEDENGNPKPHYYKDKCGETKVKPETEPLYAKWEVFETEEEENALRVESQLQAVRMDDYQSDDNGVIPGVFEKEDGFYKCIYRHYYNYIEISEWSLTTEEKDNATEVSEMPELNIESITPLPILKFVEKKEDDIEIERYFKGKEYEYIKAEPSGKMKECHDDESSVNNNSYYFTATVVEEGEPILKKLKPDLVDKDYIHLLTKYKAYSTNSIYGYRSYLKIPYKEHEAHNLYKDENDDCFADYIIEKKPNEKGQLVITYNIGGKWDFEKGEPKILGIENEGNVGIIMQDVYDYEENHLYSFCFEGYDGIEINGEYIDIENPKSDASNKDLSATDNNGEYIPKERKYNSAQILGMRTMDALNGLKPKVMFKQDITDGLNFPVKSEVDIEINRGAVSAFENYFKLAECNTFQDLENYQNNWFNI